MSGSSSEKGIFNFYDEPQPPAAAPPPMPVYRTPPPAYMPIEMPVRVPYTLEERKKHYIKYGVDPGPRPLLSSIPLVSGDEDKAPERRPMVDGESDTYSEELKEYRQLQQKKRTIEAKRAAEWKRALNAELIEQAKITAGVKPYRPQNIAARSGNVRNMYGVNAELRAHAREQLQRAMTATEHGERMRAISRRRSRRRSWLSPQPSPAPAVNRRATRKAWMAAPAPVINRRALRKTWRNLANAQLAPRPRASHVKEMAAVGAFGQAAAAGGGGVVAEVQPPVMRFRTANRPLPRRSSLKRSATGASVHRVVWRPGDPNIREIPPRHK